MRNRVKLGNKKDKIIKANIPENVTTVEQLVQLLNSGIYADIDSNNQLIGGDVGVAETGTPLNKATLLSDDTAKRLKLSQDDPTVNDALEKVAMDNRTSFELLMTKRITRGNK